MSLTYDQKSEIRIAFDEAFVPPDRRRDMRTTYRVEAEICRWKRQRQAPPFVVRIEDFSPGGVGLIHTAEIAVGSEYLIHIPRPHMSELVVLLTVVRCQPLEDGTCRVGLELSSVMDRNSMGKLVDVLNDPQPRGRWMKVCFLLFGIAGIGTSLLIN
jgi:hypothetical protein